MAQYQRFLSYLFEYEGDQKKENCGFAKVEIRGDVQRIFLSVKNKEQAEILHVFGFYRTNKGCGCVPLGRMVVKNGKGQLQYINNGSHLAGSTIRFEQLCGLVAGRQQPFSNAYATVWDDQYFGLSLFAENETEAQTAEERKTNLQIIQEAPKEITKKVTQEITTEPIEDLQTMEVTDRSGVKSIESEKEKKSSKSTVPFEKTPSKPDQAAAIWEQLSAIYPHIETLPGDTMVCLKAMPADIGRLPRQNWKLSSNGFLMYSFVKHRYIVFARVTDGQYELWVPGNYEKSEELMAQMFGFYRFRSVKSQKAGLGDFGYWCVPLVFPAETEGDRTVETTYKQANPAAV